MNQIIPWTQRYESVCVTDYGSCTVSCKTETRFCEHGYIQKCNIEITIEHSCPELVPLLQNAIDACKDAAKGFTVAFEHVSGSTVLPREESRWYGMIRAQQPLLCSPIRFLSARNTNFC